MKSLTLYAVTFMLFVALTNKVVAQDKAISETDKKAIVKLFEGVDKSKYRLQFNGGKEVYGARKVAMKDLEQVRKVRNPQDELGYVVLIVSDDGIVYIVAVSKGGKLESVLGREKAAKLNTIMSKYAR
jgi:hypothetical protein